MRYTRDGDTAFHMRGVRGRYGALKVSEVRDLSGANASAKRTEPRASFSSERGIANWER